MYDMEKNIKEPLNTTSADDERKKAYESHDKTYNAALKQLYLVSFVSVFFIAAQLTGGYLANSIAIFTDTAHLGSDMLGFGMSILSLRISR